MRRIIAILLILLCFSFFGCSEEEILPADYVKGDEVVIDNETPFVYNGVGIMDAWDFYLLIENYSTYKQIVLTCGNKIIRQNGDSYYTVYCMNDNELYYVFLTKNEDGELVLSEDYKHTMPVLSSPDSMGNEFVYEYDYPYVILNNAVPKSLSEISIEDVQKEVEQKYLRYDNWHERYEIEKLKKPLNNDEIKEAYRILQDVFFDEIINKENEIKTLSQGVYIYDFYIYYNGSSQLRYRHIIYNKTLDVPDIDKVIELNKEQTELLYNSIKQNDFWNIPTYNIEESHGLDGETTYIEGYVDDYFSHHLISMWQSWERYGIYRIRTDFENFVAGYVN